MPTLLARIDSGLAGNDVLARVQEQAGRLQAIGTVVQRLANNPPSEVGDLVRSLSDVRLPGFPAPPSLAAAYGNLAAALPRDPAALTAGLLSDIGRVEGEFGGALAAALDHALTAFAQLQTLAEVDLQCAPASAQGAGAGGEEGGAAGGEAPAQPAGQSATAATTARAQAALDALPDPLDVRGFLVWAHGNTAFARRDPRIPAVIPLFDDLRDPLDTLIAWESMNASELLAHAGGSFDEAARLLQASLSRPLEPLLAELDVLVAALPAADLARIAAGLKTTLAALGAAVAAGDLGAAAPSVAELNALLDEYASLRASLAPSLATVPRIAQRLHELAGDLDDSLAAATSLLRPGGAVLAQLPPPRRLLPLEEIERWLTGIGDWLQDVLRALDVASLQQPLAQVADGVRGAAAALDQGVITLTAQVSAVLQQVDALVSQLDPAPALAEVTAQIENFRALLVGRVQQAASPALAAIAAAVQALSDAVDEFDPQAVIAALTSAVEALGELLGSGELADAVGEVRSALQAVAEQVEALSFAPVTDQVIGAIGELTAALQAIDVSQLPGPAVGALDAAVAVLPSDLAPLTDPVLADFGQLVASGPVQLLEQVRSGPAQALAAVRRYEPAALLGDSLSKPFQSVLRDLDSFRPSKLVRPLDTELAGARQRLKQAGSPGRALQPLEQLFAEADRALASLEPGALIEPVDAALSAALERLLDILPVQETFATIDAALAAVQRAVDSSAAVTGLVRRVDQVLGAFADARAQLESWVATVLARWDAVTDTAALDEPLRRLRDAVDATASPAVRTSVAAATAGLLAALAEVQPGAGLSGIVAAHRTIARGALQALPDSPQKAALAAALDRFDPLGLDFGAPYRVLHELQQAAVEGLAELDARLAHWDEQHHAADGALARLRGVDSSPAALQQAAGEVLQAQLVEPAAAVFALLEPFRRTLALLAGQLEAVLEAVRARLDALLLGPSALAGIRDALGALTQSVLDVDLDFLRERLDAPFAALRARLQAAGPAALRAALDAAWAEALDAITLDLLLPPAQRTQLDDAYTAVLEKLRQLDPGTTVVSAVQPVFEQTVLPLLDAFDLTPLLDTIIQKLQGTEQELRGELERVNQGYRQLLAAVPSGGGPAGAGISL